MISVYDISSMSPANDFISIKYMYDIIQNVYIIYKRRFFHMTKWEKISLKSIA